MVRAEKDDSRTVDLIAPDYMASACGVSKGVLDTSDDARYFTRTPSSRRGFLGFVLPTRGRPMARYAAAA